VNELLRYLTTLDIQPPDGWEERIGALHGQLVAANQRTNLTRVTDLEDFLVKHVADSLLVVAAWPAIRDAELRIADVGCGGGFPGLPLALTFPRLALTEIDSSAKKIACVAKMIEDLELSRCRAIAGRARELARRDELRETFHLVLARAVSDTPRLIKECRRFLTPEHGALIAYKTPKHVDEERELVARESTKAGLDARVSEVYRLPGDHGERQFWILSRG